MKSRFIKMASTPANPTNENSDLTPVQRNSVVLLKRRLRNNIKEVLLRFKFCELITDIILGLFELQPEAVYEKLKELRLTKSRDSVAGLLTSRSQVFNVPELEDLYHSLLLYKTVFGSKQKKWMPILLLEPTEDFTCATNVDIIRRNLLQALRIKGLNAVVKVITFEELVWVMIIEKKLTRKRGMKLLAPKFICYEIGTPYIFTDPKTPKLTMECILRAMKYKKHKVHQLEGKDIKSMITLLKHKVMNANNSTVPYTEGQFKVGHRYIDVSKKKSRESYANKVFDTKDPITLETFYVHAEAEWKDDELVPRMRGESLHVMMTLKSKNLIGMIKKMVSSDMLSTPLPDYLQTILRSAKNKVNMKTVGQRSK